MGWLSRLLGGGAPPEAAESDVDEPAPGPEATDADERAHELEMLRSEQERLDDLAQRQLRYADYAWQPPAQGGERRADDGDRPSD